MAAKRGVKRRRSLVPEQEDFPSEHSPEVTLQSDGDHTPHPDESPQSDAGEDTGQPTPEPSAKEQEIWDAFREENYEALEQLPLSLHRSFSLILELDQQVQTNNSVLLSTMRKYLLQRKRLAGLPLSDETPVEPDTSTINDKSATPSSSRVSPVDESSTRDTLSSIARLSEEIVGAANEKVSLARFTTDLVDRYIRDLDRAIKEQETSISLGLRPGTHPASIILPPVVVPKGFRRAQQSPLPDEDDMIAIGADFVAAEVAVPVSEPALPELAAKSRRKSRGKPRWSLKKKSEAAALSELVVSEEPETEMSIEEPVPMTLKLTVPPLAAVVPPPVDAAAVDPNERRYCYCNQVSYGEMIGCDNLECPREWFHLGCVGLIHAPKGKAKWYCRDCIEVVPQTRKKKG